MNIGVDPKIDYAFKRLFGCEPNRHLLLHLVNAVLAPAPDNLLVDLEILNPFNNKERWDDKQSVVDIKARAQDGRLFNVEMQMVVGPFFPQRLLYYWAKLYQQQLQEGDDYQNLRPTISISFVNSLLFPQAIDHHLLFRLVDATHKLAFTDNIEFHVIELPKFELRLDLLETPLDIWCFFLRHAASMDKDQIPAALNVAPIWQAIEVLTMLTQNDQEREQYEARVKVQRDWSSSLAEAREQGELIGQIQVYERLLKKPQSSIVQLRALSSTQLKAIAADLEKQALPSLQASK